MFVIRERLYAQPVYLITESQKGPLTNIILTFQGKPFLLSKKKTTLFANQLQEMWNVYGKLWAGIWTIPFHPCTDGWWHIYSSIFPGTWVSWLYITIWGTLYLVTDQTLTKCAFNYYFQPFLLGVGDPRLNNIGSMFN
jgi:hypothetical protein